MAERSERRQSTSPWRWLGAMIRVPRWVPIWLAVHVIGELPENIKTWIEWLS